MEIERFYLVEKKVVLDHDELYEYFIDEHFADWVSESPHDSRCCGASSFSECDCYDASTEYYLWLDYMFDPEFPQVDVIVPLDIRLTEEEINYIILNYKEKDKE